MTFEPEPRKEILTTDVHEWPRILTVKERALSMEPFVCIRVHSWSEPGPISLPKPPS